jgi:hypothetical protein
MVLKIWGIWQLSMGMSLHLIDYSEERLIHILVHMLVFILVIVTYMYIQ